MLNKNNTTEWESEHEPSGAIVMLGIPSHCRCERPAPPLAHYTNISFVPVYNRSVSKFGRDLAVSSSYHFLWRREPINKEKEEEEHM